MMTLTDRYALSHLLALRCARVELGVLDMVRDKMQLRSVSVEDAPGVLGWLKFRNAGGANIYVRPAWPHTMTLVDDLSAESVLAMQAEGFEPSYLVETSPDNFQAWLDNGVEMSRELATRIAQLVAARFGADPGSADWRHLGRLAGFTNRKPKHGRAGVYPYVRAHAVTAPEGAYGQAAAVRAEAQRLLNAEAAEREQRRQLHQGAGQRATGDALPIAHFWRSSKYDGDFTRADLAYAIHALGRGVSEGLVRSALASRDLSHKGSGKRQDDYIDRTVAKAYQCLTQ